MKTEQPVLPWHREAAKEINKALLRQNPTVSAIIARHDPMPTPLVEKKVAYLQAQHAETLRLLETICGVIEAHEIESLDCDNSGETYCDCLRKVTTKARAHLAAHRQTGGGK